MRRRSPKLFFIATITVLMFACVIPSLAPAPTPLPTFDPNLIGTAIVETANAAARQTARVLPPTLTPTPTLLPTKTPTETPPPTATFYFVVASITLPPTQIPLGTSDKPYDCQILSRTPQNDSVVAKSSVFEARWLVANIGKSGWDANNADYHYAGGSRLHQGGVVRDFEASVSPGSTIEIVVNMQSPADAGTYSTTWKINVGKNEFCAMDLTIIVQ
ncbi:MAG: hypothetical protein JNM02_09405 [Anaerolineales bacterium]|nr:hypothetical protein [Anaerolineales bacterium]